ncbi:MAG: ATP-dependent helicase HrpB, partial [Frankiales bacterium]|nr:ATP-dependent helicase HrpB [Frankiales bacterium]
GAAATRGRALTAVGAHPRLARALLDGAPLGGTRRAAEVVAVLSDDTLARGSDDLMALLRGLRTGRDRVLSARWNDEVRRLSRTVPEVAATHLPADLAAALVVGLAFPERLSRRRAGAVATYLMAGGTGAELSPGTALSGSPWLAVAVADRSPGRRDARVRLAVAVDEASALQAGATLLTDRPEVRWQDGDVRSTRVKRLGAIVLRERPVTPDPGAAAQALQEGLRHEGLALLRWTAGARELRDRLAACRSGLGEPWPHVDDEALTARLDLTGARSRADLHRLDVTAALRALVPWSVAGRLDEVAPERVLVASGSAVRVDYSEPDAPTLAVRVQEVFGWPAAPMIAGRPLRLHLLSPARRVVAVTSDLASFWVTGYPGVRADLRGRYPRHPWPEDPASAVATRRAAPRR